MPSDSPHTLSCPSCGAPLDFEGGSAFIKCKFCKTTVVLPELEGGKRIASSVLMEEIRDLATSGNEIEAIKRYRQAFDVGLKEAKDAVELLASGEVQEAHFFTQGPITSEETGRILEQVQELLRSGDKLEAIKHYRNATGKDLAHANEIVSRIQAALDGTTLETAPEYTTSISAKQVGRVKSARVGTVIVVLVLLLACGLGALWLFGGDGPFGRMVVANGPAILPIQEDGATTLVAAFYDIKSETYKVGVLDADKGKLSWMSESLPGGSYVDGIIQAGDLVFAASQTNLMAFMAGGGTLVWQAEMPDRLNYGNDNMLVIGDRIITNNADQSIHAYDTSTGALVWDRRLQGYDRQLRQFNGSLVVIDYIDDNYHYGLLFLDPADGSEQHRITPTCQTDEYSSATMDTDAGMIHVESENALYLVYDSSPGCIQRIDLASGQPTWQTLVEGWFSFSGGEFYSLTGDDQIIFTIGNSILAVDKTSGTVKTLMSEEDYDLLPLALSGDTLIVRLRRTRGTERFELRGIKPDDGTTLWQLDMENAKPIDPPDVMVGLVDENDPAFSWSLSDGQLLLLKFQGVPNQVVIQRVDPANGELSREMTVALKAVGGDFYSVPVVIGWRGDLVFLYLDGKLIGVNVVTGDVTFHYP